MDNLINIIFNKKEEGNKKEDNNITEKLKEIIENSNGDIIKNIQEFINDKINIEHNDEDDDTTYYNIIDTLIDISNFKYLDKYNEIYIFPFCTRFPPR